MKILHVEASTFCNARCPLCPRSLYGYKVEDVYPEVHLQLEKFKQCLAQFPDRTNVDFNGNLGDSMMNPDILELAMATNCRTAITTNGSIGTKATWQKLAKKNVFVTFSIDGLEDTNHLYRQDVEWNKIMDRVKWYIEAGGMATWKFVPFKHNAHQLEEAEKLSKELGFVQFLVEDHGRNYGPALDKNANVTHWILPADGSRQPGQYNVKGGIERYKKISKTFTADTKIYNISCEHENDNTFYIDAFGRIGPCCYQGFDLPGMPFVKLEDFPKLKQTWTTTKCNPICASTCSQ